MPNAYLARRWLVAALLALSLAAPQQAQARASMMIVEAYDGMDLQRMLKNIESGLRKQPDNPTLRLNQARAHVLFYALDPDTPVRNKDGIMVPAYRDVHRNEVLVPAMPQHVPKAPTAEGRAHLEQAIQLYSAILEMPASWREERGPFIRSVARLGRGWCREQAGDKQGAIADYRTLLKSPEHPPVPGEKWTDEAAEAATYLVKLLDPVKDREEIAGLKEGMAGFDYHGLRYITPIAIPLDWNTTLAQIEDRKARVSFEVDARHPGQHWSWITPRAGWLAYDPKQSGKIASGIRLFGNISYWMFWDNGYQAMSALDDNGDGVLSGKELEGLVVWVDANGNGVCDPGEIRTLASLGIQALSYKHEPLKGHPDPIVYSPHGVLYRDGSSGPSYDIILHARK